MKRIKNAFWVAVIYMMVMMFSSCAPSIYTRGVEHDDFPKKDIPIYDGAVVFSFEGDKDECEIEYGSEDEVKDIMEFYQEELGGDDYIIVRESDSYDDEYYVEGYIDDRYFEIEVEEAPRKYEEYFVSVVSISVEPIEGEKGVGNGEVDENAAEEKKEKNGTAFKDPDGYDVYEMDQKRIKDFDWESISEDIKTRFQDGMDYYDEGKYKRAFAAFSECAEEGHPTAQGMLGDCYYYGEGTDEDIDKAVYWYKRGAWLGDEMSQYSLGFAYLYGESVEADEDAGIFLVQCSANQGYMYAQTYLGWCYEYGQFYDYDMEKAAFWYAKAADQGDLDSILWLGKYNLYYEEGNDIYYKKAVEYFEKAIELESIEAYYYMAICYYNGYYYEQDYEKTIEYLQPALEAEDSWAQSLMGWMYYEGEGVEQDYEQTAYYYELSAKQGNPVAMNNYGDLYETGLGVEQDYDEAFYWYRRAVAFGDGVALYNVGHFYYEGWSVERDYDTAVYYYKMSAEQEEACGQCGLAICYENGHGVEQDLSQAKYWYQLAADQGYEEAMEALERLSDVEADTQPIDDDKDDLLGA